MGLPEQSVTLTPAEIAEFNQKLGEARHNVNNYLALIVAASELIKRKPETTEKFVDNIAEQPQRIVKELQGFTKEFERRLGITH
jgi:ABC-type nitrate/sulfonate/bicarbonate transport system substrate-binding protein